MISNDLRSIPFKHFDFGFADFPMITGVNFSPSSEQPNNKVNISSLWFLIRAITPLDVLNFEHIFRDPTNSPQTNSPKTI